MKVSDDQNKITLDDGSVFVALEHESGCCTGCDLDPEQTCRKYNGAVPCWSYDREDNRHMIFVKEESFIFDSDKWDNRELGADEEFVEVASDKVHEELKSILGNG